MTVQERLDSAQDLGHGRDQHEALHKSAFADDASKFIQQSLSSHSAPLSAIAYSMDGSQKSLLAERLLALKPPQMTLAGWTKAAGVSRQAFTDLKKRGSLKHETIVRLLNAVGYSWSQFENMVDATPIGAPSDFADQVSAKQPLDNAALPRDIPVLGTAEGAAEPVNTNGDARLIETLDLSLNNEVEYRTRPTSLARRKDIYALYVTGDSMSPRHEAGDLIYVDPHRPASIGDDVIIQLRGGGEDGSEIVRAMIKRLVRRGGEFIELEQYNPPFTFRLPTELVARMHRVLRLNELV